jgi:hypothetical protein
MIVFDDAPLASTLPLWPLALRPLPARPALPHGDPLSGGIAGRAGRQACSFLAVGLTKLLTWADCPGRFETAGTGRIDRTGCWTPSTEASHRPWLVAARRFPAWPRSSTVSSSGHGCTASAARLVRQLRLVAGVSPGSGPSSRPLLSTGEAEVSVVIGVHHGVFRLGWAKPSHKARSAYKPGS